MGQMRRKAQALAARVRRGDAGAARELLAHSVAQGHDRLALRRFFLARALGARDLAAEERYCAKASDGISVAALKKMVEDAARDAAIFRARGGGA